MQIQFAIHSFIRAIVTRRFNVLVHRSSCTTALKVASEANLV